MHFSPDLLRGTVSFVGAIENKLAFREAISALHDIVVSDLRFHPRDKTAYKEWVAQNESIFLAEHMAGYNREESLNRMSAIQSELKRVRVEKQKFMAPFHSAQQKYFNYLYTRDRDLWIVLDPVITVHPDELFFECFSQDESSYGKLSCSYNMFRNAGEFSCGTTNVDYSSALYNEFQKIREYRDTELRIDPGGFSVETSGESEYKEVKIDLPESWVRGFLQVSSAATLPTLQIELHPMDLYTICSWLRRFREKRGPRSLRYILKPGQPVRVMLDPWGKEIVCSRSLYTGSKEIEVKTWGRRRLHTLERLIPIAKRFTVHLLGTGLPAFYVADLGEMQFTLGLSGWTTNDWSRAGNFDLLAPRAATDETIRKKVFTYMQQHWFASAETVAGALQISVAEAHAALGLFTQAGRVIYDLSHRVYRLRELTREPLPMDQLRFSNPREELAERFITESAVQSESSILADAVIALKGTVKGSRKQFHCAMEIDADERMRNAVCDCSFYKENKLFKGPCEHMLAVRQHFSKNRMTF